MPRSFRLSEELFQACAKSGTEADWREFIERFHSDIKKAVCRAARRWGDTNREILAELVQDIYLKLCDPNRQILAGFRSRGPGSEAAFIHVVATNLVNDHFKSRHAEIHGGGTTQVSMEQQEAPARDGNCGTMLATEREILLREIEDRLQATGATLRDRKIFWFYYRHGMKAREIAELPGMELTTEGVESVIHRLTVVARDFIAGASPISKEAAGS